MLDSNGQKIYNNFLTWYKKEYPKGYNIHVDYNDYLSDENIYDIIISSHPKEIFYDLLIDCYEDPNIINNIIDEATQCGIKINKDNDELIDNIADIININLPEEHFLNQKVNVDIFVDTGDGDYDFVSNAFYPHYNGEKNEYKEITEETEAASLFWLAKTQNYNKKTFYNSIQNNIVNEKSKFIKSVYRELENMSTHMPQLVFLKQFTLKELIDIAENKQNIKISKNTTCGLYDRWLGGGSLLEIKLERDLIVPYKFAYILPHKSYSYNIKSCYGLLDYAWTKSLAA